MFSYHIVQPRETLYLIALKYNIAPCLLLRLNKLRRAQDIRPGMRIIVPCYGGNCEGQSFAMQIEDNNPDFFDYSDKNCQLSNEIIDTAVHEPDMTNVPDMMDMPNIIIPNIPSIPGMPEIPRGEYFIGEGVKFERYEVKPGDSVFLIAKRFNTTLTNIIIANGLRPPYMIFPGQELLVPYIDDDIVIYTVKKGDTVYKIAMEYSVPLSNIIDYNYLDKMATIYPGQQLIIKLES